ncbi:hypothetical protein HYN59_12280 [Flavobacterium album]|uniref:Uncharacterized protein n=1 Tax=Flavobacterium album TaxID=2175091 RepID=A0A2S1QZQ5_9FLAO|nr:hypothetical protein [Flavobacterium album]AWH85834.1 hypothetical protein HYN59_12280 [Flavobacterium album]
MKISKLLVLLAVLMTLSVSAQKKATAAKPAAKTTSSKPSKAETMDWIAAKMQENLAAPRKFISYSNGLFVYSKQMNSGDVCTTTIDLNKITGLSNEYSDDFFMSGKQLGGSKCGDGSTNQFEYMSIAGPNYNDYSAPFNFTPDQTLVERMKKALATLVEYNGESKKAAGEKF